MNVGSLPSVVFPQNRLSHEHEHEHEHERVRLLGARALARTLRQPDRARRRAHAQRPRRTYVRRTSPRRPLTHGTTRQTKKPANPRSIGARTIDRCVSPFPRDEPSMETLDRIARHRSNRESNRIDGAPRVVKIKILLCASVIHARVVTREILIESDRPFITIAQFSLNCMTVYPYNKTYPIDGKRAVENAHRHPWSG